MHWVQRPSLHTMSIACVPTQRPTPSERSYTTQDMCNYALFRSDPGSTTFTRSLGCTPWGCYQYMQPTASVLERRANAVFGGVEPGYWRQW